MKINPITLNRTVRKYNNIPFKKRIDELIYPFGNDLVCYGVSTPKISIDGIKQIIQKYSPKTQVENLENYSESDIRNPSALFYMQLHTQTSKKSEPLFLRPSDKILYIEPDKCSDDNLGRFLAEVIHEATHVFQQESDNRMSYEELCETYYKNSSDKEAVKNTFRIMDTVFIYLEKAMYNAYTICTEKSSRRLKDRDNQFKMNFDMSMKELIQSVVSLTVSKITNKKINHSLLYDYCILRARNEEEAYRNMLNFKPQLTNDSSIGLQIEMYDKIAQCLSEIKEEYF